jgi:hypothetical protein
MSASTGSYFANIDHEQLFGSDSGEDEAPHALLSYFVDLPEFRKFYDASKVLGIVRGRKGMGKSALLKRLALRLREPQQTDIVISTTGHELMGMGDFSFKSHAYLENHWKQVICKRICIEIGKRIELALTDDAMAMVEAAEIEGFKGANVVSALTDRIGGILAKVMGADSDPAAGATMHLLRKGLNNPLDTLRRFQEDRERVVWLLIDDIDAKYVDDDENQHRVGAFFSAIRSLAFSVEGLRIRASVRTDVWRNLRRMEDQDKLRQYVIDISWHDQALRSIFVKRILSYLQRERFAPAEHWDTTLNHDEIVEQVFVGRMPWDQRLVEPFLPIKILAGNRPRWMGQLCKLAGGHAGDSRISINNINHAMNEFGQEKIADIQKEHIHQFADLPKLIDVFRAGRREYNRFQLVKAIEATYLQKVAGQVPHINGYPYTSIDQLGDFLFQVDFIACHHPGKRDFTSCQDDPDRWHSNENNQNKLLWAVNPSYRRYLRII